MCLGQELARLADNWPPAFHMEDCSISANDVAKVELTASELRPASKEANDGAHLGAENAFGLFAAQASLDAQLRQ